jgi:hypothetical protein
MDSVYPIYLTVTLNKGARPKMGDIAEMDEMEQVEQEEFTVEVPGNEDTTLDNKLKMPGSAEEYAAFEEYIAAHKDQRGYTMLEQRWNTLKRQALMTERTRETVVDTIARLNGERSPRKKEVDLLAGKKRHARVTAKNFFAGMNEAMLNSHAKAVKINPAMYETLDELRAALAEDYIAKQDFSV